MTLLYFTFGALPYTNPKLGTHIIHCWVTQSEPTQTDSPGDERRASKDTSKIVADLMQENINDDTERLLQEGEIGKDVLPVFSFALGVTWDRANKMASYKKFDYSTLCADPKFSPVLALGSELYDYTFSVLRARETLDRKNAGLGKFAWDRITVTQGREMFARYCETAKARHKAWEINKMRFDCTNLRNGYCSPSNPKCPCYRNGRCIEIGAEDIVK